MCILTTLYSSQTVTSIHPEMSFYLSILVSFSTIYKIDRCVFITGVSSRIDKPRKQYSFMTERRMYSYTTSVSAMSRTEHGTNIVGEMISPWGNQLPTMTYGRHSAGAVVLGLF